MTRRKRLIYLTGCNFETFLWQKKKKQNKNQNNKPGKIIYKTYEKRANILINKVLLNQEQTNNPMKKETNKINRQFIK